ncbi:MAG: hypothetical protein ACK5B9_07650 [Flavobacteriia bacterium]|jgi:hypothetical protein
MNKFESLILFCLFYQLSFGQNEIIDNHNLLTLNLKGKVKTVKSDSNYQYFDTLGNLVLDKTFTDSGSIINYSLKYDSKFRISEIFDSFREETQLCSYDTLNRVVTSKYISTKNSKGIYIDSFYYNSNNLLNRKDSYYNSTKRFSQIFKYDSLNRLICNENHDGGLYDSYNYEYDQSDRLIKMEWLDADGSVIEITTNTYEEPFKRIQQWVIYDEGKPVRFHISIFEHGNDVEFFVIDSNNLIQDKVLLSYEFDKSGNWIKMTRDDEGEIKSYEREIEYY